jgi:hypothetical protein
MRAIDPDAGVDPIATRKLCAIELILPIAPERPGGNDLREWTMTRLNRCPMTRHPALDHQPTDPMRPSSPRIGPSRPVVSQEGAFSSLLL